MAAGDGVNYIVDGENNDSLVLNRPLKEVVANIDSDFSLKDGTYTLLRAKATTKGDVGLGSVDNYSRADYDARYLNETSNLSDLPDKATSRTNLDVYSKQESNTNYLGASAKAVDSNKLDALNSTQFLRSDVNNAVVRASNLRFVDQESANLISDGDVIWDLSDGIFNQRSNIAYQVWDSGNDGTGSGLDADKLDGLHATSFAQGDDFNVSGDYTGLRARNTTKGDVGLGSVDNYSRTDYDGRYLGLTAKAADAELFDGLDSLSFVKIDTKSVGYLWPQRNSTASVLFVTQQSTGPIAEFKQGVGDGTTKARIDNDGSVWSTGNITASSDVRIKTNIEIIPEALGKVNKLSGYTFDRTDSDVPRQTGVIAQELLEVLPEAVTGGPTEENPDGHYSVAYGNLVGLLIESIKELNMKVEELEKRIK